MGRLVCIATVAAVLLAACDEGHPAPEPLRITVKAGGLSDRIATGFALDRDTVITVAHALEGAHEITVEGRRARVVRLVRALDVAALRVAGLSAAHSRLDPGGSATRIVLLRGRIEVIRRASLLRRATATVQRAPGSDAVDERRVLELGATVEPGDSGAPVIDSGGDVVGMVFARSLSVDDIAWAVDAIAIARALGRG